MQVHSEREDKMEKLPHFIKNLMLTEYREKKITRKQISKRYRIKIKHLTYFVKNNNLELWDDNRKIPKELRELVIKEYTENRVKRDEICIRYKIERRRVDLILNEAKIVKWDLKRTIVPKNAGKKKKSISKRYYNPKAEKDSYSKMFYEFNN